MTAQHKPPFYITTAISYPNGQPHIGHAYEVLATDTIARFMRLDGHEVFFLTGTDEHGLKMQQTAEREGLSPRALADRNAGLFRTMAAALNCSNDDFIRTTEPRHYASCQELWKRMEAAGDIYKDRYAGWYSVRDEAFYDEAETTVRPDGVRVGGQGTPVEWTEEETYFFRLASFQERLLKHYTDHPDFILPEERRNEVVSFVKSGLRDLSVSRTTFDWGIPVPGGAGHVMYVWVDALANYVTGAGFPDVEAPLWRFWPADVHVIGKDIIRFHAVYWPAFLMSAGLPLPKRVFGHGFLNVKGEKMSKSVGNVVDPFDLIKAYGVDQVRYFFLREVQFGQDGSYTPEAMANRINADLANDIGNLAQRSLSMIAKNCDNRVPQPGAFTPADQAMLDAADGMLQKARTAMARQQVTKYLDAVWAVIGDCNKYFADQTPWILRKTDPARMGTVLYVTAEIVRQAGILMQPVMPASGTKLLDLLQLPANARNFANLGPAGRIAPGAPLGEIKAVFPRYEPPVEAAG